MKGVIIGNKPSRIMAHEDHVLVLSFEDPEEDSSSLFLVG